MMANQKQKDKSFNVFKAWFDVLFKPDSFFKEACQRGPKINATVFLITVFLVTTFLHYVTDFLLYENVNLLIDVCYSFVLGILGFLLYVCVVHLGLLLIKVNCNLGDTFRIAAFAEGVIIFGILPKVGAFITVVWFFLLMCYGLTEKYKLPLLKTIILLLSIYAFFGANYFILTKTAPALLDLIFNSSGG